MSFQDFSLIPRSFSHTYQDPFSCFLTFCSSIKDRSLLLFLIFNFLITSNNNNNNNVTGMYVYMYILHMYEFAIYSYIQVWKIN